VSGEGVKEFETSELRMAAILVWHHRRMEGSEAWEAMLETKAEQSRRVERFRAELHRVVGKRDDISFKVNGGCIEAEVEDLRFIGLEAIHSDKQKNVVLIALLGRCPSCGAETASKPVYSFARLGEMLERFEPYHRHICYAR
jgi:C4-dicarboxylate-specific signal transduction histidine kinase